MKIVKRIITFLILPVFMFGGGFAAGTVAMDYFYPGRNFTNEDLLRQIRYDENLNDNRLGDWQVSAEARGLDGHISSVPEGEADGRLFDAVIDEGLDDVVSELAPEDAVEVTRLGGTAINADTVYVIQEYFRDTRDLTEEIIPVPENFIGMDHDIFTRVIADFDRYPTLYELQKGFLSCEVILFSPSKVVIRKSYGDLGGEMKPGYYLVNEDGLVTVYLGDLRTVFMNTSISVHLLPDELRREILYTKFVEGDEGLFGFLEAYSS